MTYQELLDLASTILQPAVLLSVASALLSLVVSYVPKWRELWAAKDATFQRLGMLGATTFIAVGAGVLSFTGVIAIIPANKEGILLLIFSWLSALWTNQTTYNYSPQVASVKAIRAARDN